MNNSETVLSKNIESILSELEEIILSTLKNEEMYGLQVSKTIELRSNNKLNIGFGSLYPALRRLESKGFVKSRWGEESIEDRGGARRRYYKATPTGLNALSEKLSIKEDIRNSNLVVA